MIMNLEEEIEYIDDLLLIGEDILELEEEKTNGYNNN